MFEFACEEIQQNMDCFAMNLALDGAGQLVYLAPSRVNLQITQERWPDLEFAATREHAQTLALE